MALILVVEDDPTLQDAYKLLLVKEGYKVRTAGDGEEGLKLAEELKPDLILLDILMPNSSGIELLQKFDLKKHPETKVIVTSNMQSPNLISQAMELGASKYMTKATFSPKEVAAIVRETLSGEKAQFGTDLRPKDKAPGTGEDNTFEL